MKNKPLDIFVDDGEGSDWFFVSVPISENECLSFDNTQKGKRVILQRRKEKLTVPKQTGEKPTMEWDTLHFRSGKLIEAQHVSWYDRGKEDEVDGEVWETINEWSLDESVSKSLLKFSLLSRENKSNTRKIKNEMLEFEKILRSL